MRRREGRGVRLEGKCETQTQCRGSAGPTLRTLAQHFPGIGPVNLCSWIRELLRGRAGDDRRVSEGEASARRCSGVGDVGPKLTRHLRGRHEESRGRRERHPGQGGKFHYRKWISAKCHLHPTRAAVMMQLYLIYAGAGPRVNAGQWLARG